MSDYVSSTKLARHALNLLKFAKSEPRPPSDDASELEYRSPCGVFGVWRQSVEFSVSYVVAGETKTDGGRVLPGWERDSSRVDFVPRMPQPLRRTFMRLGS